MYVVMNIGRLPCVCAWKYEHERQAKENRIYGFFRRICHNNGFISETSTFTLNGLSQRLFLPRSITVFFSLFSLLLLFKWQKVHLLLRLSTSSEPCNKLSKNAKSACLKCSMTWICWAAISNASHYSRINMCLSIFPQLALVFDRIFQLVKACWSLQNFSFETRHNHHVLKGEQIYHKIEENKI